MNPRPWQRLPVMLAVALLLRLVTLLPALHSAPYSDEAEFHGLAQRLAAGQGLVWEDGRPTSWRAPLWPAVLAAEYAVTGPSPEAGRLLQVGLGVLLVWLVWALAGEVSAEPRVRAMAGWWAVLSPTLVGASHTLFSETLFGLCLGLALYGLLRGREDRRARWVVAAGVGLGLGCLCRGSTLLFVPPALVWVGVHHRSVRRALAVGVLCGLVVAPWTARNVLVHHGLIVVDSNGPVNLFWGVHPATPVLRPWEMCERPDRPMPVVPPGAGEVALQRRALYESFVFIRERPGAFLLGLLIKTGNLWGLSRELPGAVNAGLYGPSTMPKLLLATALAGLDGFALLALGLLGLGLSDRRPAVELQLLVMAYLTLIHAASYGHSRYRFGALMLLLPFAALALSHGRAMLAALPDSRRRWLVAGLVVLGVNWGYEVVVELMRVLG